MTLQQFCLTLITLSWEAYALLECQTLMSTLQQVVLHE